MSMLELGGKRYTIPMGDVGPGERSRLRYRPDRTGRCCRGTPCCMGQPDGQVVIRKAAPEAEVMINGVRLGAEPTPLLHGDKLQVGGHELTFVDERRSGSTQYVPAMRCRPGEPRPNRLARSSRSERPGGGSCRSPTVASTRS